MLVPVPWDTQIAILSVEICIGCVEYLERYLARVRECYLERYLLVERSRKLNIVDA